MVDWKPIDDTAPRDRRILLWVGTGIAEFGRWNDDRYAKTPRPFWDYGNIVRGTKFMRENQPTHWAEEPAGPVL